ncbi:MAG: phage baseplate assembly protein V [Vicinamibacterales bacterium]
MAVLQSVYSGSVIDTRDPERLGRVLVSVPAAGARGVWARVATMMAGPERGTWFIPEVGDEVLVAFDGSDARAAYVIGSLWNAKARPPADDGDPSTVRLIRSRSGVTIRVQEEKTAGLVIETPDGQRISLQDGPGSVRVSDEHGNAVTFEASGVTVTASGKLTVNASAIEVNASQVTVNAGMSRFSGVVQCDTLISNAVISASYSPGAGNIW